MLKNFKHKFKSYFSTVIIAPFLSLAVPGVMAAESCHFTNITTGIRLLYHQQFDS